MYWFSEGLSDYYALRILFESGRWSAGKYAKWINKHIAEYQHNPARNADNDAIRRGYWSKRNTVGEVAYQRGLLLGLRWHKLARDNGQRDGLDRLFKTLVQRARTRGFKLSNAKIRRAGVELLRIPTGGDEIEEAFLRRLEEDRTRGFLRAAAWAAAQEVAGTRHDASDNDGDSVVTSDEAETVDAGVPRNPAL